MAGNGVAGTLPGMWPGPWLGLDGATGLVFGGMVSSGSGFEAQLGRVPAAR